jgi:hypothetical protein
MAMRGVITTRHVLTHAGVIVREFGMGAFLRCCLAAVRRRKATFLECAVQLAVSPEVRARA